MQVEIFENGNINKLKKQINDFLDEIEWDNNGDKNADIVDIKLTAFDNGYAAMVLYQHV